MKYALLTALLGLALVNTITAQDSLHFYIKKNPAYGGGAPLIVIKGEEISRFPSSDFLDAVNGLFPAVFSQDPDPNDFLFVVNGNILFDINAISLFDIAEIRFTRAPLDGSLFPFSKSGIFYIKTKIPHRGFSVNVNTQYNFVMNRDKRMLVPGGTLPSNFTEIKSDPGNKAGHFQSHNISIEAGGLKTNLYISSQLENFREPAFNQQSEFSIPGNPNMSAEADRSGKITGVKNFLDFGYRISQKVSAGISGLYYHGKLNIDSTVAFSNPTTSSNNIYTYKNPTLYYYGNAYINIAISPSLYNKASFEIGYDHYDMLLEGTSSSSFGPGQIFHSTRGAEPHQKGYLIKDHLEYSPVMRGKFKASVSTIFSYLRQEQQGEATTSSGTGSLPANYSYSRYRYKPRIITLNPLVNFSFDDKLTGYVGMPFRVGRISEGISAKTKFDNDPYAGLIFNFKKILRLGQFNSRFDLGLHYSNYAKNISTNYWLTSVNDPLNFGPRPPLAARYSSNFQNMEIINDRSYSAQLNTGWLNDRILTGLEWTQLSYEQIFVSNIIVTPYPYIFYVLGKVTQNRFSVFAQAKIIDNKSFQWTTRLNAAIPKIKYDIDSPTFNMGERKYDLQAGWQNQFRAGGFYGQLNGLMALGRRDITSASPGPTPQSKESEFVLNYIMAGYDLPNLSYSFVKRLSVYAQARNPAASRETKDFYEFDRYIGAGVNIGF